MVEYIEREALLNELSASCMPIDDREISGLFDCDESIRDIIEAMPAADVRPERHGWWIINSDEYSPYCSACSYMPENEVLLNFCPACGARMDRKDGGSDDN